MKYYVFDTNIVSLILRHDRDILSALQTHLSDEDGILGCPLVWYEIRRGLLAKDVQVQLQRFEALFSTFLWQDYTRLDWDLAAAMWAKRRKMGAPIGDADLLIGVYAYNREAILVTDNEKDFVNLNVDVQNWKSPNTES